MLSCGLCVKSVFRTKVVKVVGHNLNEAGDSYIGCGLSVGEKTGRFLYYTPVINTYYFST